MKASNVYAGSDGTVTRRYYLALSKAGPLGDIAVGLFRAQKCSSRAKKYRGRNEDGTSYRELSYSRKNFALKELCKSLLAFGAALGIRWGWGEDAKAIGYPWVLYVDLPQGQVSFHSPDRFKGPDYNKAWDGQHLSCERVLKFCDAVYESLQDQTPLLIGEPNGADSDIRVSGDSRSDGNQVGKAAGSV